MHKSLERMTVFRQKLSFSVSPARTAGRCEPAGRRQGGTLLSCYNFDRWVHPRSRQIYPPPTMRKIPPILLIPKTTAALWRHRYNPSTNQQRFCSLPTSPHKALTWGFTHEQIPGMHCLHKTAHNGPQAETQADPLYHRFEKFFCICWYAPKTTQQHFTTDQ